MGYEPWWGRLVMSKDERDAWASRSFDDRVNELLGITVVPVAEPTSPRLPNVQPPHPHPKIDKFLSSTAS